MALKLRHWILAALVGSALLYVAYLPTGETPEENVAAPGPRPRATAERRRADALGAALARARAELQVAARRDSLVRAASARFPSPTLQIAFTMSPASRRALEQAFTAVWRELAPLDTSVRVVVVVRHNYALNTYLLPYATDGRTCVASLSLGWEMRQLGRESEEPPPLDQIVEYLRNNLSACAFYAAFGPPGRAIERWLEDRSFDLAGEATWAEPARPALERGQSDIGMLGAMLSGYDDRFRATFEALSCGGGDTQACRRALLQPPPVNFARYRPRMNGVVLDLGFFFEGRGFYGGRRYLADVARAAGRERFVRFWRSPLSPDSAFAAAIGAPMDRWTARWERERLRGMVFGNRVSLSAVTLSLLVAAAITAATALLATRRTVG